MSVRPRVPLSDRAGAVLRQLFTAVPGTFAFRLWDGSVVTLGAGEPRFTVVIPAAETFLRLMRDPTPRAFGEAYIESTMDIEGDLFAAMEVAAAIEDLRLPLAQRLRLLLSLGPVALLPARARGTRHDP
jgi:cyclopropane-fatty-acyl-phospholipid synthase